MPVVCDIKCSCGNPITIRRTYLDSGKDLCLELEQCEVCGNELDEALGNAHSLADQLKKANEQIVILERELGAALLASMEQ